MASMRAIKRRIKSVGSTQQITKAMNLVAASKLQKSKALLASTRPYYEEIKRVVAGIITSGGTISHPLMEQRPVKNTAIILITGDRGLCGGYNVNVSKAASKVVKEKGNEQLIIIGTKGRDYFRRRRKKIIRTYSGFSETPMYDDAAEIGQIVVEMFKRGEVDEVYLAYTEFKSTLTHIAQAQRILPLQFDVASETAPSGKVEEKKAGTVMEYEPNEDALLDYVIPKYIAMYVYGALVNSSACEWSARMVSMDSATENAADIINSLSLKYNRARQGAITQELTEIVSGANALE